MGGSEIIQIGPAVLKIIETGTLVCFMFLVIVGLCGFVKYLLLELRDTRKDFTASTNNFIETVSAMKEVIRDALHKKNSS